MGDYDAARLAGIAESIARIAGVSTDRVRVTATAESGSIDATIEATDAAANEATASTLRSALSSRGDAAAKLGISAAAAPTVTVLPVAVQVLAAPPPPTASRPETSEPSSLSSGAVIGLSLGVGFLGAVIGALGVLGLTSRARRPKLPPSTAVVPAESDRNRMIGKDI